MSTRESDYFHQCTPKKHILTRPKTTTAEGSQLMITMECITPLAYVRRRLTEGGGGVREAASSPPRPPILLLLQ